MSDTNKPSYKFSLQGIELHESQILPVPTPEESASGLNFNLNLENMVHEQNEWILCRVTVSIATQRSMQLVGKLVTMTVFKLADYNTVMEKVENGQPNIPAELQAILNGIAISTTRGIMFVVFKGTPLHGALLPLMDVKAFAPELPLEGK